MSDLAPGWRPDPSQRHEYRYWDGSAWSDVVADGGMESSDPLAGPRRGGRLALLAVVLVGVAAVGVVVGIVVGDEGSSAASRDPGADREEALEVLSTGLYENFEGALTHEEAACAANRLVDGMGLDRLLDLGLGPRNPYDGFSVVELTTDEQHDVVTWLYGCISDGRLVEYLAGSYSGAGQMSYEQAECMAQRQLELLGPDRLRELAAESYFSPGESMTSLADPDEQEPMEAIDQECAGSS